MNSKKTNRWLFALYIGFFAGLFLGSTHFLFYFFKFTKLRPAFLLEPIYGPGYLTSWRGYLFGIAFWIIISILLSFLYTLILSRVKGFWMGLVVGVLAWIVIYVVIGPLFNITKSVLKLDFTTFSSQLCLMLIWGLFIGYSISFEFTQESTR